MRCAQLDPPRSGSFRTDDLELEVAGRTLTIAAPDELRIAAFTGPVAGALRAELVASLRDAQPRLLLYLGGLGDTLDSARQSLARLVALGVPTLFIAGGDDRADVVQDAFASLDDAARSLVVHASGLHGARIGAHYFAIVPGAPLGRFALDDQACGFVDEDLTEVQAAAAPHRAAQSQWLLSWYAPTGLGATMADGTDLGSPELGRLAHVLGSAGGIFAQPAGGPRPAPGLPNAHFVRRLGVTGSLHVDGRLLVPGYTLLTLSPTGLRHQP